MGRNLHQTFEQLRDNINQFHVAANSENLTRDELKRNNALFSEMEREVDELWNKINSLAKNIISKEKSTMDFKTWIEKWLK